MAGKKGQEKRFWSDDEKQSISDQARASGVSVARRYSINASLAHKCLRDPRFAPSEPLPEDGTGTADFIDVAVVEPDLPDTTSKGASLTVAVLCTTRVDITLSDGRCILVEVSTSLIAVVGLFQG